MTENSCITHKKNGKKIYLASVYFPHKQHQFEPPIHTTFSPVPPPQNIPVRGFVPHITEHGTPLPQ